MEGWMKCVFRRMGRDDWYTDTPEVGVPKRWCVPAWRAQAGLESCAGPRRLRAGGWPNCQSVGRDAFGDCALSGFATGMPRDLVADWDVRAPVLYRTREQVAGHADRLRLQGSRF